MSELAEAIAEAIKKSQQKTGSDYTARVSRVEGNIAYVQFTGSDIADTPVSLSISCKPGDMVHVRVADGKAWITGNDTTPPTGIITHDQLLELLNSGVLVINTKKFKLNDSGDMTIAGKLSARSGRFDESIQILNTKDKNGSVINIGRNKDYPMYSDISVVSDDYGTDIQDGSVMVIDFENPLTHCLMFPGLFDLQDTEGTVWIDGGGVHDYSDIQLKTDMDQIDPDIARQLNPVRYRFKTSNKIRYGFIAQEVQEVMPDAVSAGRDGYLALNYNEFIAPILALVQEQDNRITQLENRLKALEEQINGN